MLDESIKDPNKSLDRVVEILKLENVFDEVNEKIISKLNLSFITPVDREDIYSIAGELATGVDMLNAALQQMIMYRAGHATEKSKNLTALLVEIRRDAFAFARFDDACSQPKESTRYIGECLNKW